MTHILKKYRSVLGFISVILTLLALFSACQKEVEVEIPEVEKHVIIQGSIEPNENPYVYVTRSSGYFEEVSQSALFDRLVKNAIVTVSDNSTIDTLKYQFMPPAIAELPFFWYTTNKMTGKVGGTYTLKVEVDGKVFTSTVSIPAPIGLDSLFFKPNPPPDSLGLIHARLTDPPGLGNYYRWFAKRKIKDKRFYAPGRSVFEDRVVDGKSFSFDFVRGRDPNSTAVDDTTRERRFFKKGDEIIVKFCTIPKEVFEFYMSYEMQITSNGNPFASPSTIKSNIKGGALGVWACYGTYLDTILAK
jgi:hypothetical protein